MKLILTSLFFSFSIVSFTCDYSKKDINSIQQIGKWLGKNSSFSKSYIQSKCALDEILKKLPVAEKKVIANLIAKSYDFEIKKIENLKTYNY